MVPEILPIQLQQSLQSSVPPLLLDVRESEEFELTRIPNSLHIPLMELESRLSELRERLEAGTNSQVVVICRVGGRSALATQLLLESGFEQVKNLQGGINAYAQDVDSSLVVY